MSSVFLYWIQGSSEFIRILKCTKGAVVKLTTLQQEKQQKGHKSSDILTDTFQPKGYVGYPNNWKLGITAVIVFNLNKIRKRSLSCTGAAVECEIDYISAPI